MPTKTTAIGTLIAALRYPMWPLPQATIAARLELPDGEAVLSCLPTGQFRADVISKGTAEPLISLTSCPVSIDPPIEVNVAFAWELPSDISICANGQHIGSSTNSASIPTRCKLPQRAAIRQPKVRDYSKENTLALRRRHDRLVGHQPIPGRERASTDYLMAALAAELSQMKDLLTLIKNGNVSHALGLASRLRLLLVEGDPMPALQLCAATLREPLIVFTDVYEEPYVMQDDRRVPPSRYLSWNISCVARAEYCNPVDLDVWLETTAGREEKLAFTHRRIIKAVGDTVASHLDRDIHPLVSMLRQSHSGAVGGSERDFLVEYIGHIATEILPLMGNLLQKPR